MGIVTDRQAWRVDRREEAQIEPEALAAEMVRALLRYGGQAHRDVIIAHVASARRVRGEDPPADLADQILRVFSRHCEAPDGVPERPLFRLPFGPDSRRWMLTDNAPALVGAAGLH